MVRLFACLALILLLSGCAPIFPLPSTPIPPPVHTASPVPTMTETGTAPTLARSTRTPGPTRTPMPTRTPRATSTPKTIPTQAPGAHLSAVHFSGQTFLTWDETGGNQTRYYIYRSTQPLAYEQLDQAVFLAEVAQGSANFYADRFRNLAARQWDQRYLDRLILPRMDHALPDGKGLFVWTLSTDDLDGQSAGQGYYYVTVAGADGVEQLYSGYTIGPVDERVGDPLAIEVPGLAGAGAHLMVQYMDLQTWNPTFHAPNRLNDFYGLHPTDPRFDATLQYAFDYVVYNPVCDTTPDKVPVILYLEDFTRDRAGRSQLPAELQNWCAYKIYPFDTGDTRWFGFAEFHDYRQISEVLDNDTLSNFTEQRLIRMAYDLLRQPPGPAADPQRVYVLGWGSGGIAASALAQRFGNFFAAGYAINPVDELAFYGPLSYEKQTLTLVGSSRQDLPIFYYAPDNLAAQLQDNVLTTRSTVDQNIRWLAGMEAAPLGLSYEASHPASHSLASQLDILTKSRQPWSAFIIQRNTAPPVEYRGLPPALQPDESGIPFYGLRVVKNETIPAFSGNTLDTYPGTSSYNGYNGTLLWSSSWMPWRGAPVDQLDRWEMSFCPVLPVPGGSQTCGSGPEQRVNITPRRLQNFILLPGMRVSWHNYRLSDNELLDSGTVKVASDGTLTIRNVLIPTQGSRLVLEQISE